ncbi:conserved hypothetical protein [Xenorhabdus bovienii str. puntauvense]|uniref:Uncharacterized protein n=1 Tax=Xenorhabdus bovienii str. puntauvense TaxID=1398201 RepID=A0A077NKP2_XENBV|nr:conserved hypothetical protein [Xenorhabdus bovienii str. puntauvense]
MQTSGVFVSTVLPVKFTGRKWSLLTRAWNAETFVEAINTTTRRNVTLLACIERVAFTTNVQIQVVINGRVDGDNVTARARCSNCFVFRMNTFSHRKPLLRPCRYPALLPPDTTRRVD